MTTDEIKALCEVLGPLIRDSITAQVKAATADLVKVANDHTVWIGAADKALKPVIENSARSMRYRGVWKETDEGFERGDVVTHSSGLWFCHKATAERPGISNSWQLCMKAERRT